ncbi:MAG: hypothetical protein ACJ79H_10055 [Myxococcales bacterium]
MPREIRWPVDAWASFTITLNALAAAAARQSTLVTNGTNRPRALIFPRIQSGTAPVAGTIYECFLLRGDATNRTDGAGASDAGFTYHNAPLLGSLANDNGGGNTFYQDIFDTAPLGLLGTEFGVAIRNSTGQALNAASNTCKYALGVAQVQ